MAKYRYDEASFGRLEVGTESSVDRSKSIKTFLMQLFPHNRSLIGTDSINACYGGTAALLSSLAWVESSQWDGRLALVVCTDIAVYAELAARPTGGCGAVAIVIGPNAPIVPEPGLLASHFVHAYDFYKPLSVAMPLVDGPLTLAVYFECLDECFLRFREKCHVSVDDFDYVCFHTPFINQIKKAIGRLVYLKGKAGKEPEIAETRNNPRFLSETAAANAAVFEQKVRPGTLLSAQLGNGYTASLYLAIASLVNAVDLAGKRVLCFSYGSGAAASMFSLRITGDLSTIKAALDLDRRLAARVKRSVPEYEREVELASTRMKTAPYEPVSDLEWVWEEEWILDGIDAKWIRLYRRK
jgi:hydroxymethylglutaryl-CoA synthase